MPCQFAFQKRKTTTVSLEVHKGQHKYVIGPRGSNITEILELTGVSVEMPPLESPSETITLRGEQDKLGPAITLVYSKVCKHNKSAKEMGLLSSGNDLHNLLATSHSDV